MAVGAGLKTGVGSLDTELEHGAGQGSLDITGNCFGKLIHRGRAGPSRVAGCPLDCGRTRHCIRQQ